METQLSTFWQRNRIMIKGIMVGGLILALLIPTFFIQGLVEERKQRMKEVAFEISSKWATAQTLQGPFLLLPYEEPVKRDDGTYAKVKKMAYVLPDELNINGELFPEERYRSIFKVIVYKSELNITGQFPQIPLAELNIPEENIIWKEAKICIGLNDSRGIEEKIDILWDGRGLDFNSGLLSNTISTTGVNASFPLTADTVSAHSFKIHLKLKGSERLFFTPLGKQTSVKIKSPWQSPAFDGNFLPGTRTVNNNGFSAEWNILHYNRNIPQYWTDADQSTEQSAFGINLLQGNDSYSKTMRSVKYALLFIALTFIIFFFIEIIQRRLVHPLQYVLVGMALCIFYTLLLSVSEYIDFNIAYTIAASATVLLITLYTKSVFGKWTIALTFGIFLGMLYGAILILIQLEDGALLFGSIGLFLLLAIIMYYSRKIDWYNQGAPVSPQNQSVI